MSEAQTKFSDLSALGRAQFGLSVAGGISSAFGALSAASAEKYRAKSLALNYEHQKTMALFNMRMKESQAQHIARQYNKQMQIMTLKQGAAKGSAKASFAARGIKMGTGSTLDAFVSSEVLASIDRLTMNSNKVRAMNNKRLEAVGLQNKATMLGVSASNAIATASSISPFMNMSSSLLTSAGNVLGSLPSSMFIKKSAIPEPQLPPEPAVA